MIGIPEAISSVSKLFDDAINKIWPDPESKARAEAVAIKATADAAISQLQAAQSIMMAEATSSDPWTSRARPSMLYVFYIILLAGLPMGILSAIDIRTAMEVAAGAKAWWASIPSAIIDMATFVLLGYTAGRTLEKIKGAAK